MNQPGCRTVVALGGNAISDPASKGDIPDQFVHTRQTVVHLADLVERGHRLLITHGNGPQVGNILRRVEIASKEVYPIDLGLCVADSQAGMGYMISQCLVNEFRRRGQERAACTIVTTVLVDRDDPALKNPTKPIGSYFSDQEARCHSRENGWHMVEVPGRGMRRVVASPKPKRIMELELIRRLFEEGQLVVAAGGGGIPVIDTPRWGYEGIEAVIDKDQTAVLLALGLEADLLAILTDLPKVCVDYGKPTQQELDRLTVSQARAFNRQGQFPAGSMGPKIEAAIEFLERSPNPQAKALITACDAVIDALDGKAGTWIVRDGA